jgi:hypothetical protein
MNKTYSTLSIEVQNKIMDTLKAFDDVNVIFEYGKYHVSTGICVKKEYGEDFKVIGKFTAKEMYTVNTQIENYINEFMSYPIEYKGKKDWNMIKKMNNEKEYDFDNNKMTVWTGKINISGNFELTEKVVINL